MNVGDQFESKRWGPFVITKVVKKGKEVRIKFMRTKNSIWVQTHRFLEGKIYDLKQPNVYGVGFNNYDRDESYFDVIRQYWYQMMRRCHHHKTHTMHEEWHDLRKFYRFLNERENEDLHIAITTGLLVAPRNHYYSPDSMIIIPNISVDNGRKLPKSLSKDTWYLR